MATAPTSSADQQALKLILGSAVIKALEKHAVAKPADQIIDRFAPPTDAERMRDYDHAVWHAGLVALLRHLARVVLDAATPDDGDVGGLLWATLDATPHVCDEEAADAAAADHRRRGGDLYHLLVQMQRECRTEEIVGRGGFCTGRHQIVGMRSDDVYRYGGTIISLLLQVCDHNKIERPQCLITIEKVL
jgi:hypothetical protein